MNPVLALGAALGAVLRGRRATPGGPWAAALLREWLVRLGPVPIKVGQLLGARVDLLDARWAAELAALTDRVPVGDLGPCLDLARARLAGAAGLTSEVCGAGSVAVVLDARLHGRAVAVKVVRPGVRRSLDRELDRVERVARVVARVPWARSLPVLEVVAQVLDGVRGQVDLAAEADRLEDLRAVAQLEDVVVPAVVPTSAAVRHPDAPVLVMERLDGLTTDGWVALDEPARHAAVERLMAFVYRAMFAEGLVHADLHPGNVYARADGSVAVVDAGMVYRLDDSQRRAFLAFFWAFSAGDGASCARIVGSLSEVADPRRARRPGFEDAVRALVRRHSGLLAKDFRLAVFAGELFAVQRAHGLRSPAAFALPVLGLLVVEGTVRSHHPDLDFQALARPHLIRACFSASGGGAHGELLWRAG